MASVTRDEHGIAAAITPQEYIVRTKNQFLNNLNNAAVRATLQSRSSLTPIANGKAPVPKSDQDYHLFGSGRTSGEQQFFNLKRGDSVITTLSALIIGFIKASPC